MGYAPFGHGNFPSPSSREGKLLIEIGRRHNRTPKQVALNYLTRHPSTFTIPKTTRSERVKENSGGVGWQLTEDEANEIDRAFPVPPPGHSTRSNLNKFTFKGYKRAFSFLISI